MKNIKKVANNLSKKLTLAVTSVLFLLLTEFLEVQIDFESLLAIVAVIVSYIIGQSCVDIQKIKVKKR